MARKTKAELKLEEELVQKAQQDQWNEFVSQYPSRFAAVLFSYSQRAGDGFAIDYGAEEDDYRFICDNDEASCWSDQWLPVTTKWISFEDQNELMYRLESVEGVLVRVTAHKAKIAEKIQQRAKALAKLTAEERELLGL